MDSSDVLGPPRSALEAITVRVGQLQAMLARSPDTLALALALAFSTDCLPR